MKIFFVFFALLVLVASAPQKYTTKYDNVDLNQVLRSDRLLRNYVNCLLDRGRCSPDGQELKEHIEDALQTDCGKCSEKQQNGSRTIVRYLIKNKRHWWDELQNKYDPKRIYIAKHADELKAEGIVL